MTRSRAWLRAGLVAGSAAAACQFTHGVINNGIVDGPPDSPITCGSAYTMCGAGDTLVTCSGPGVTATTTQCAWGCVPTASAHCGEILPTGSAVGSDLGSSAPTLMVVSPTTIDGTMGKINGTAWPAWQLVNGVGVFRFGSLMIGSAVNLVGANAIALVSDGDVMIAAVIDGRPGTGCVTGAITGVAGPGGFTGAAAGGDAAGSGGGFGGGGTNTLGGGGGGHGGSGGSGGADSPTPGPAGGSAWGSADLPITVLVGGGGGGGGGHGGSPIGGGGGAALQIVSNKTISIGPAGGINVGGCGGNNGASGDSGGGGGAGGAILLEALTIALDGVLAANGGGGGGGGGATPGAPGSLDANPALGGFNGGGNSQGGQGGAGATLNGSDGTYTSSNQRSGGGGGGVGRIRINTRSGSAMIGSAAIVSPSLGTTATQGSAGVR